ncbi:hypothetical protein [Hydrogenophaga sp.]|uniref:hypothetical protein n=1 Tax=Hydrogenophaga sp. TaxID=1904254 RepID=UPI003BAF0E51
MPQRAPDVLFPVKALSKVFRGKFLQALTQAQESGDWPCDPVQTPNERSQRLAALRLRVRVRVRVRANDSGGKRVVQIGRDAFTDSLLQHVLPSGFKRLRQARALLQMPQPQPQAIEDAQAFRGPP